MTGFSLPPIVYHYVSDLPCVAQPMSQSTMRTRMLRSRPTTPPPRPPRRSTGETPSSLWLWDLCSFPLSFVRYARYGEVYSDVMQTQNLTTQGILTYLGNRLVEASENPQVKLGSPAKFTWQS
jgi:hypothetical protein